MNMKGAECVRKIIEVLDLTNEQLYCRGGGGDMKGQGLGENV